eukprot:CAMPEP_0195519292 /NCGR_PEP_ID=MMETSP0794_2-20130614/14561_1 /TAXON_ID=515487 /ORGANISM="Stephanopyxis turris, Strain CCMP 815" /LENGTH=136 /DNA_ID=CAMNT_0040648417 /DNA_START=59 /DNA_END=469 /DNA_ORIENTATION=-
MRFATTFFLSAMLAAASGFGLTSTPTRHSFSTALSDKAADAAAHGETIVSDANKWRAIKNMDEETAKAELDEEMLAAYTAFHASVNEDIAKMKEIAKLIQKQIEIPQVKPKSKNQRKRDAWVRAQHQAANPDTVSR